MGWSAFQIIIVIGMVATGTLNTISAGFQQRAEGEGRAWASEETGYRKGRVKAFDHPYLQAMGMMLGECLCMAAFLIMTRIFKKGLQDEKTIEANRGFSPLILYPPALFDLLGTSMNYVGMILSYPSSFQMLRGSVIVFTAGLSIVFLKRWPKPYQWFGIAVIIGGLCIVGAGDMIYQEEIQYHCLNTAITPGPNYTFTSASTFPVTDPTTVVSEATSVVTGASSVVSEATTVVTGASSVVSEGAWAAIETTTKAELKECYETKIGSDPLTGDIIIVIGEVFHALQFIYEEYYLSKFDLPPLKVVGYEGIFGFLTIGILLWPMYFIKVGETFGLGPEYRFEDAIDGFTQIGNSPAILGWTFGNMISIACFNFAGVTVTKELNGTTRAVLDNIRQIFIWIFSLIIHWQTFNLMTPIGFVVLILGIWIYNDVILRPLLYKIMKKPLD